jgi:hypothetical protein
MGLAESFNAALYDNLQVYAAWFPVVNTIKIGDFGVIEDGVFRPLGNIAKFGIIPATAPGAEAEIDFVSDGTTVTKFVAGAKVDQFPPVADLDAKLELEFKRENSCLLKAKFSVLDMQDIHGVAKRLKDLEEWENHFKVVSSIYTGDKCVIVACRDAGTKVSLSAKANLLQQVELGKVEVAPSFESTNSACFKSVGATGVVGIRLFKLGFLGGLKILSKLDRQKATKVEADVLKGKLKSDW